MFTHFNVPFIVTVLTALLLVVQPVAAMMIPSMAPAVDARALSVPSPIPDDNIYTFVEESLPEPNALSARAPSGASVVHDNNIYTLVEDVEESIARPGDLSARAPSGASPIHDENIYTLLEESLLEADA
ncbi:hypothetical protein DFP72DRAFT_1175273 [Ephemerocybe angulata]|uniref:Secreted protein n=1 Tax=Ephemerocybe angulata TaxID=980116 RepID=A0A8H6HJB5_9AGAR|nr:hypothetical protein DFP72DRAFT_1175273 [Tulosesus angulatus]